MTLNRSPVSNSRKHMVSQLELWWNHYFSLHFTIWNECAFVPVLLRKDEWECFWNWGPMTIKLSDRQEMWSSDTFPPWVATLYAEWKSYVWASRFQDGWANKMAQLVKKGASLTTWVPSQEPMWWKERTDHTSCCLSSISVLWHIINKWVFF